MGSIFRKYILIPVIGGVVIGMPLAIKFLVGAPDEIVSDITFILLGVIAEVVIIASCFLFNINRRMDKFSEALTEGTAAIEGVGEEVTTSIESTSSGIISRFDDFADRVDTAINKLGALSEQIAAETKILSHIGRIREFPDGDSLTSIYLESLQKYAAKWVDTFDLVKESEHQVKCWCRVFGIYIDEELNDISAQSVATNIELYWRILTELTAEIAHNKRPEEVLCLWAVTNVLPENWYNWQYPPPDGTKHTNRFLNEYRNSIENLLTEYENKVEMKRWILVKKDETLPTRKEYGIELYVLEELVKQSSYYIVLENGRPISGLVSEFKDYFGATESKAYSQTDDVYCISEHSKNGVRNKLFDEFVRSLHSQPASINARAVIIDGKNKGILEKLPKRSPDFLVFGLKNGDNSNVNWVLILSARLNPAHETCFIHILTKEEPLNNAVTVFQEFEEVSIPLSSIR